MKNLTDKQKKIFKITGSILAFILLIGIYNLFRVLTAGPVSFHLDSYANTRIGTTDDGNYYLNKYSATFTIKNNRLQQVTFSTGDFRLTAGQANYYPIVIFDSNENTVSNITLQSGQSGQFVVSFGNFDYVQDAKLTITDSYDKTTFTSQSPRHTQFPNK